MSSWQVLIVKIGDPRPDLCLGRVFAFLDLDRKPQVLDIDG